jgi:hypothetical protein
MLHQGDGSAQGLPKLDPNQNPNFNGMSVQDMLQMLADYLANFNQNNQNNRQPPRMLGNLGAGNTGGGPGGGGSGGGGSGGVSAPSSVGPAVKSTANASGTPDIQGLGNLSAEQKQNAQIIIDEGRKMGASNRDIQVALMTAMQESSLKNLPGGDRDSAGLFQQRPSCGWGTYQQVTDPHYSAQTFFKHLMAIPNRDSMQLTQEAQQVQQSAFPDAYAKWQGIALALLGSSGGPNNNNTAVA